MGLMYGALKWRGRNGNNKQSELEWERESPITQTIISQLEQVDTMIREEIRREIDGLGRDSRGSRRLGCLMRSRADVQGAITSLLGACH